MLLQVSSDTKERMVALRIDEVYPSRNDLPSSPAVQKKQDIAVAKMDGVTCIHRFTEFSPLLEGRL